jgi:hypothetical protein
MDNKHPFIENRNSTLEVLDYVKNKLTELEGNIFFIDESNLNFRNKVKTWNVTIKNETKIEEKQISHINKSPFNSFLSFHEENSMNKILIKQNVRGNFVYGAQIKFNIFITLMHSFLYNLFYTMIIPTSVSLLKINNYNPTYIGVILAATPFTGFISNQLYTRLNNNPSQNRFKFSLIVSELLFILTHFVYLVFYQEQIIGYLVLSRILLGLSNAKIVDRKYLIQHTFKYDTTRYSLYYFIYSTLGLACGKKLFK